MVSALTIFTFAATVEEEHEADAAGAGDDWTLETAKASTKAVCKDNMTGWQ